MTPPVLENFQFSPVTEGEVQKVLYDLKDSSPGFDNIPGSLFPSVQDLILKPLTHILNLSLKKGVVPDELKIAEIIPAIFNHYRSISILPALAEVLEKLVYQRLLDHLDRHNILYIRQYETTPLLWLSLILLNL